MEFQGFQHNLPDFVIALIAISLIAVSFFSYRKITALSLLPRIGLITLRTLALLLVFVLFLNPYFFSSELVRKNPRLLFLLDNSESVSINKGSYQGIESYQSVLDQLSIYSRNNIDLEFFSIGSSTAQLSGVDQLTFNEGESNFYSALSQVQELEDDFDGVVLLSDGIITFGRNPALLALDLTIPIYSIALGDTTTVKDIAVNNIVSNPTGYTNTFHNVRVDISQNGYEGESITIDLKDSEGNTLATEQATFSSGEEIKSIDFSLSLEEPGLNQYSIIVSELEEEWSTENNSSFFSIDVLDGKTKVLHISFEVHPDVKTVRSVLEEDQNIELSTMTWFGSNQVIENEIPSMEDFDLIIMHGVPYGNIDQALFKGLSTTSTLYFQLPKSRINQEGIFPELFMIQNSGNQLFQVQLSPNSESNTHPILELPEIVYQNAPPLVSSLRSISTVPDAVDLINSSFQNVKTPNSILSIVERGGVRRSTVAAWGWFKMYQSPNEQEREFVIQLVNNLVGWTSNNPDNRRLKISPSKPVFNLSEEVIINANLNNESGESESEASIELNISTEDGFLQPYNMSNVGGGAYELSSESLGPGLYSYTAVARKGNREIDTQTGEFLIQQTNSELVNSIRNDNLLQSFANETGGRFFEFENVSDFWQALNSDNILQQNQELVESYHFPVRSFWWFVLVLSLLGVEWLTRKYYALP
ncbi:MAG: VWA domain-containing protein [Balneola sp.]|nr:MAG: VWA domain-containing protein [Balneola sp.]